MDVYVWLTAAAVWTEVNKRKMVVHLAVCFAALFAAVAAAGWGHHVDSWVHHRPGCHGWNRDFFSNTLSPLGKRVAELTWVSVSVVLSAMRFILRKPKHSFIAPRSKMLSFSLWAGFADSWIGRGSAPNATDFHLYPISSKTRDDSDLQKRDATREGNSGCFKLWLHKIIVCYLCKIGSQVVMMESKLGFQVYRKFTETKFKCHQATMFVD